MMIASNATPTRNNSRSVMFALLSYLPAATGSNPTGQTVCSSCMAPYRNEPFRLAPDISAPDRSAMDRLAPDRSALDRLAPDKSAPDRSAMDKKGHFRLLPN